MASCNPQERETAHGPDGEFDAREFRLALGDFPTGVTVVTALAPDGSPVGMTVSSFNSVSLDPPLVLWSVARAAHSFDPFSEAGHFCVHILSEGQQDLSQRFATPFADKFDGLDVVSGLGGAPIFDDCVARFECATWQRYDGGDHLIILGRVERFRRWRRRPLLFTGGVYGLVADRAPEADDGGGA